MFQFLHVVTNTYYFLFFFSFDSSHPKAANWYLTVVFMCISLMISDVEHLFMYLLAICISSLENVYSSPLPYLFIYLFIFWLHWVFIAVCGLSLVAVSRGYSPLQCTGFPLRWLLLLRSMGSRHPGFSSCGSQGLERRLSSCGAQALYLCGMWDLPRPGLEPVSPALAGRFLTTAPPGKSLLPFLKSGCLFLLLLSCRSSLYILDMNPLSDI